MKCKKDITALILVIILFCSCFSYIEVVANESLNSKIIEAPSESIVKSPESSATTPDSDATTPDSDATTPDSDAITPDSNVITPESIVTKQESNVTTPEVIVTTQESIRVTPEDQVDQDRICNVTIKMGYLPTKRIIPSPILPERNPQIRVIDSDNKEVEVTVSSPSNVKKEYGLYKIVVKPGTYTYEAWDPGLLKEPYSKDNEKAFLGGGSFQVTEDGQKIDLRRLNFSLLCDKSVKDYFKEVQLKDDKGQSYKAGFGSLKNLITKPNIKKEPFYQASFVVPAVGGNAPYYYEIIPKDQYQDFWYSKGEAYVYPALDEDNFQGLNLSDNFAGFVIAKKSNMQIKVPHGAELKVYHRVKFYRPPESIDVNSPNIEEDYDVYNFDVPERTQLHYEVRQQGKVTQAKTFGGSQIANLTPIIIPSLKDNPKQVIKDIERQGSFDANLLMNVPDSKCLHLKTNESFELSTFRNWQAIESITGNYYVEPDYHYDIAYGDSVLVSKDGIITAQKPGVSVIHVTYDALEYETVDAKLCDENGLMVYSAIFPENTGVIVVNVDGNNEAGIKSNISQSEFDRIYFAKNINGLSKDNYAEYKFKPTIDNGKIETVCVQTPLARSIEEGWDSYIPDSEGYYTIKLYEGRNIVKIQAGDSVVYYVLTAQGLDVKIENITHPGETLTNADQAKITFDGLHIPLPKLAAVYNPGFPEETWIQYEYDGARVDGHHTQYNITTENNTLELYLDTPGMCHLTNGRIHTTSIGDTIDEHRAITKSSKTSSYSGGDSSCNLDGYFCILPDIEFQVEDAGDLGEKGQFDLCCLNGLQIISTNPNDELKINDIITLSSSPVGLQNYIVVEDSANRVLSLKAIISNGKSTKVDLKIYKNGKELPNSELNKEIQIGKLESNPTLIEIVVIPKDPVNGYAKTYSIKILPENYNFSYNHRVYYGYDLKLNIPDDIKENNKLTDGVLRLEDDILFEKYGWGLISTLKNANYIVTVPYNTKEVNIESSLNEISKTGTVQLKSEKVSINDEEISVVKNGKIYKCSSKPITLTGKETQIKYSREATYDNEGKNTLSEEIDGFIIKVIRAEPPRFLKISSHDDMKIKVKYGSKIIKPNAEGLYELESSKTYDVIVMMNGHLSKIIPYKVTSEENQTMEIKVSDLEKVPKQAGTVTVRSIGYNSILRADTTISIEEPKDLALQKYVEYNHGGYTALHALLDAFDTGINKVKFSCYKGKLKPEIKIDTIDHGKNASWICEVNGKVCDPENTLVMDGDKVDYYYNSDYEGMQHVWFNNNVVNVKQGDNAELTLLGTKIKNDGTEPKGIEGAMIKINGKVMPEIVTDQNGKITIPSSLILDSGQYTISAEKLENGKNILTYCIALINVKKVDVIPEEGKLTVKFRLIGDAKHDGFNDHGKYVTWIASKKMTFTGKTVSVYDVFTRAMNEAGLDYIGAEKNYVSKIKAPKAYGGYWLSEFTNGKNSGWMYTVNGNHPLFGLKDCEVTNGDVIIWHYVDDYKLETSFEGSKPSYPNRWLEAEDINPPTDGTIIDMGKGNKTLEEAKENGKVATTIINIPSKIDTNGKTYATVSKSDVLKAISKVNDVAKIIKQEKGNIPTKKIVLEITDIDKASSVETTLPKEVVLELNKNIDIVVYKTPIAEIEFDKSSFSTLAKEATEDAKLTIRKEKNDTIPLNLNKISEFKKEKINDRPILSFIVEVGNKEISELKGRINVKVPYQKSQNEIAEVLVIYNIKESGELVIVQNGRLSEDGKFMQASDSHWSTFAIGYNEVKFVDTANHWAKKNILYLSAREIIKGKSENSFLPNKQITRAEFAQILANLSEEDLTKYNHSNFKDVSENAWYTKAVAWAVENGIAQGTGNSEFSPNANITRQDMSVMISKYAKNISKKSLSDTNKAVQFADDYKIAVYAKDAVNNMQKAGIIKGVKNNLGSYNFNPKANATRAEAVTMIANYIQD